MDPAELRFVVVGGAGSLRAGADRAAAFACRLGVPEVRRDDAQLAVHECLANALEHGHDGDASRPIEVEVARGDDTVTVRITDDGVGAGRPAVADPDRGRGRALVRALTDGVVARPTTSGTSVTLRWWTASDASAGRPGAVDAGSGPVESIKASGSEVESWHG